MIDPVSAWAFGAIAGGAVGFWMGRWWPRFSRYSRMGPPKGSYGGRLDPGSVQRGNGSGGPTTPKPDIIPKPQFPHGRVVDLYGCTVGYIPLRQGGTPNPPPEVP